MIVEYLEKIRQEMYEQKLTLERQNQRDEILSNDNAKFISALEASLDENYEQFSPRNINQESYEKIDSLKIAQDKIDDDVNKAKIQIANLNAHLAELDSVLKVARENSKSISKENNLIEEDEIYGRKILETQEFERQRIARDLHDSVVQNLTSMIHKIEICTRLLEMDKIRCKLELEAMSKNVRLIIDDIRRVIYDLRPMSLDDIGLEATLEREISKLRSLGQMKVTYEVEGKMQKLEPVVSLTILRIVQEACSNIRKYAEAENVRIYLKYELDSVQVKIEDDGIGFDVDKIKDSKKNSDSGFGIPMMKERVFLLCGKLEIDSKPGEGTSIKIRVPIGKEEKTNGSKNCNCR